MRKTAFLFVTVLALLACNMFQPTPVPVSQPSQVNTPVVEQTPQAAAESTVPPGLAAPPTQPVTPLGPGASTADILQAMGGYPCNDDSDFTCVNLIVPVDHLHGQSAETISVVFAVLPASGTSKGLFVTAVGGPGGSGVAVADDYTYAFDPSITENFDIVFFDQRGVNLSGGLQCAQSAANFYRADWRAATPDQEAALLQAAQTFSSACAQEMGDTQLLPFLGTEQVVRDLDAFRQTLQLYGSATAEKIWLYGESYGTQLAQTYATQFPQHLAALILDGTVDLSGSGLDFYRAQAEAFNQVLVATLQACNADERCARDMGGDALAVYDQLAASLAQSPRSYVFPLPSGGTQERSFTLADLESAAAGYLYSEGTRLILLRALAAASKGDLTLMARLLYDSLSIDPESMQATPDPSFSDAVFYGVECEDYNYSGDAPQAAAEAYLRAGDAIDQSLPHFASIFYGDIVCPFWPAHNLDAARPAPLTADGIPTLVLGATADPATPVDQGRQVFSRLADGYLVTVQGGAHVVYGRGDACVDDLVTAFLVNGQVPAQRETSCDGVLYEDYVPVMAKDSAQYNNALDALEAVDNEIYYLSEYYYWDGITPATVGCTYGGVLSFELNDAGTVFNLQNCAFSEGLILSGAATYNDETGIFAMDLNVSGRVGGKLFYTHDADGNLSVSGRYDRKKINLTKSAGD
jgi:pimeloyl-ACP methyl ester carboxylesterase